MHSNLPAVWAGFIPIPSRKKEKKEKKEDETGILQFITLNLQLKKHTARCNYYIKSSCSYFL